MSADVQLGPYTLGMDPRGVRIRRDAPNGGLRAVLFLTFTEPGRAPTGFTIARLWQETPDKVQLHAYTTDRVALDAQITFRPDVDALDFGFQLVNSSEDMTVRFGVHLELTGEADPRWLIPGLFYNENRVRDCQRMYPAYSEIQRDPSKFLANHWNFRSDRAATPVVFCTTYRLMGFLSVEEVINASNDRPQGLGISSIGLSGEEGHPQLCAFAPYVEDPVKYSYCHESRTAAEETFVTLEKNEPLYFNVQTGLIPVTPDTSQVWDPVYRAIYNEKFVLHPLRPKLSTLESERIAVEGLLRWHLDEANAMLHETSTFDKHFGRRGTNYERQHMHVGWLSGIFPAYVLLWHGRDARKPEHVRPAQSIINLLTSQLTPCGTLWPMYTLEEGFGAGFGPEPGLAHSRTIGEAILFLIRAFRLELQANTMQPAWFWAIQSNLKYILSKQREDGALPAYWYVDDGEVFSYGGASGMCWIAALVAFDHFGSSAVYREAAIRAGEYYATFIEDDFIYGCVEDLPFVPTVDDCHWAVISYLLLYELDRQPRWLDLARRAANLAFTYRMTYNIGFHSQTMLAQAGFRTRGGDIASVATPYLSPAGLVSYGEMRKLSALTGDRYFEQRAFEGRTYATQLLARIDGEFNARSGQAVGQVFHTDWWQPKGMVLSLSHAYSAALIVYDELLERTMQIPTAAIEGNQESIMQAANRSQVNLLESQVTLPDPVEIRRQREIVSRRSRDGVNITGPLAPSSEALTFEGIKSLPLRSNTVISPTPELAPALQPPAPGTAGGVGPSTVRPREIPGTARSAAMTPAPPGLGTPPTGTGRRPPVEPPPAPAAPSGPVRRPMEPAAGPPQGQPRREPLGPPPAPTDLPRREFARMPSAEVSPPAPSDLWNLLPGADQARASRAEVPKQQFPANTPRPVPPRPPTNFSDDAIRKDKSPLQSRHTPLPADEGDVTPMRLSETLHKPLLGQPGTPAPLSPSRPAMPPRPASPGPNSLPTPPPMPAGGLLSNLFGDDDGPRVRPLEGESRVTRLTPDPPSRDAAFSQSDDAIPKDPGPSKEEQENVEIKWKIF